VRSKPRLSRKGRSFGIVRQPSWGRSPLPRKAVNRGRPVGPTEDGTGWAAAVGGVDDEAVGAGRGRTLESAGTPPPSPGPAAPSDSTRSASCASSTGGLTDGRVEGRARVAEQIRHNAAPRLVGPADSRRSKLNDTGAEPYKLRARHQLCGRLGDAITAFGAPLADMSGGDGLALVPRRRLALRSLVETARRRRRARLPSSTKVRGGGDRFPCRGRSPARRDRRRIAPLVQGSKTRDEDPDVRVPVRRPSSRNSGPLRMRETPAHSSPERHDFETGPGPRVSSLSRRRFQRAHTNRRSCHRGGALCAPPAARINSS